MKVFRANLAALALAGFLALPAVGQDPAPAGPCDQPEAAQFDFWLGEWDVYAAGRLVGRNTISRIHGGCTLFEDYAAAGGGFGDGRMELTGRRRVAAGLVTDRIIWTANADGTVGQLWELSEDGGETWQVLFDGLYRRAEPDEPERDH